MHLTALGLATKSRLEIVPLQKKKNSDISSIHESINESLTANEPMKELENPTIGRMPDRFEAQNANKLINQPMKFQPSTNYSKQRVSASVKVEHTANAKDEAANQNTTEIQSSNENTAESHSAIPIIADEEEFADQDDCDEDDNDVFGESITETDPFAEFDTKIDPSLLTGVNEEVSIKYTTETRDKINTVDSSVKNESDDEDPDFNSGYAEPDDSIKRSEQLSSDSGYIEPLDTLSSSRNSIANSYRQQVSNASSYIDETSSSNESNPSPRFGESEGAPSPCLQEQNKTNFQQPEEECKSPFKRVQPKVMIPPPRLNSYTDDLLAPLHNDYMRTPSSDMEDFNIIQHSQAESELRRKVREEALKVWGKSKKSNSNEEVDSNNEALRESDEDDENTLGGDLDVFYSKDCEQKSSKFHDFYVSFKPKNVAAEYSPSRFSVEFSPFLH